MTLVVIVTDCTGSCKPNYHAITTTTAQTEVNDLQCTVFYRLDCDAECAVLERNRRMALALEIKNPDLGAKLGNPTYTDFLKDYTK